MGKESVLCCVWQHYALHPDTLWFGEEYLVINVSNTFLRSMRTAPMTPPASSFDWMFSRKKQTTVSVGQCCLKPNCVLFRGHGLMLMWSTIRSTAIFFCWKCASWSGVAGYCRITWFKDRCNDRAFPWLREEMFVYGYIYNICPPVAPQFLSALYCLPSFFNICPDLFSISFLVSIMLMDKFAFADWISLTTLLLLYFSF